MRTQKQKNKQSSDPNAWQNKRLTAVLYLELGPRTKRFLSDESPAWPGTKSLDPLAIDCPPVLSPNCSCPARTIINSRESYNASNSLLTSLESRLRRFEPLLPVVAIAGFTQGSGDQSYPTIADKTPPQRQRHRQLPAPAPRSSVPNSPPSRALRLPSSLQQLPATPYSNRSAMAAADSTSDKYEEVFEEGDTPKEAQTVQRIRANSTIMQLNKILGQ